MARSRSSLALGLGLLAWIALLFAPMAFVQTVQADDADNYGTVIGIVSSLETHCRSEHESPDPALLHSLILTF